MSLALGCLQAVLDMGHHRDWFASQLIMALTIIGAFSGVVFVIRGLLVPHNIIDLHLFRNRNRNVTRTLGSAIGAALAGTLFVRQEQVHWNLLGGHISDLNPNWSLWLERAGMSMDDASTPAIVAREMLRHAQMQAFADLYWAISLSFLLMMPFVALLRRPLPR